MTDKSIIKCAFAKMNELHSKMEGRIMKDRLEIISIILILIGMLMAMNVDTTRLYRNFIGIGIATIGILTMHIIGKDE